MVLGMTDHPSTRVTAEALQVRQRELTRALLTTDGDRRYVCGVDDVARRLTAHLEQRRSMNLQARTSKESFVELAAMYAETLDEVERTYEKAKTAVTNARDLALEVVADFEAAERQAAKEATQAAKEAAEAARVAEFEAAVQDEVARAERERLAPIEAEVRERLAKSGAA